MSTTISALNCISSGLDVPGLALPPNHLDSYKSLRTPEGGGPVGIRAVLKVRSQAIALDAPMIEVAQ